MNTLNTILPLLSAIVSFVGAAFVLVRYAKVKRVYLLFWGLGLLMYGIGGLCEALFGVFGWSPLVFRLWYLFGAILVAAWLGQGTVYLLARKRVAHILTLVLIIGSLYGAIRVFSAALDPSLLPEASMSCSA